LEKLESGYASCTYMYDVVTKKKINVVHHAKDLASMSRKLNRVKSEQRRRRVRRKQASLAKHTKNSYS
jgi:hypothetical protein